MRDRFGSVSVPSCLCVLSVLFLSGCGGSSPTSGGGTSDPAPALSAITPSAATAGSFGVTLTATGSNFTQGSEIQYNGTAQPTLYVSSGSLQAPLTAQQLASAGTIAVTVVNPQSAGGQTSASIPLTVSSNGSPNPAPTIASISPGSASMGSQAVSISVSGANFIPSSTVDWNGTPLTTNVVSSSSLTAQIPASDLSAGGAAAITVVNPNPGGGTSGSVSFSINATGTVGQITVNALANSLAWDQVNQVIYLSLPSVVGANGNSVQILNPVTGDLGTTAFAGSEPNLLSVSSSSKYLYVSLNGASTVQRLVLPGLTKDIQITLGSDSFDGPFYAMDLQASPAADGTVAVVRETPNYSPAEEGGVVIYDNGVARPAVLCGWIQSGCYGGANLYDTIQWNSTASTIFAANNEDTAFDFYTIPVTVSGFGKSVDYPGLAGGFGERIHYDATTGYVYDDNGSIIDPLSGTKVGTFAASGLMVPDGANGKAYFLGQFGSSTSGTYTIESFDINKFVPLSSVTIKSVVGTPTHLIRWGTNGLAFTTKNNVYGSTPTGAVYLISGSIVSSSVSEPNGAPSANVQRTWSTPAVLERQPNRAAELRPATR